MHFLRDSWQLQKIFRSPGVLGGLYVVIVVMENMIFRYTTCCFLLLRSESSRRSQLGVIRMMHGKC